MKRQQWKEIQPLPLQIEAGSFLRPCEWSFMAHVTAWWALPPGLQDGHWVQASCTRLDLAQRFHTKVAYCHSLQCHPPGSHHGTLSSVPMAPTTTHCSKRLWGPKYRCILEYLQCYENDNKNLRTRVTFNLQMDVEKNP